MRSGVPDQQLKAMLLKIFNSRAKDGIEAEQNRNNHAPVSESMSTIGG
jgi:cyclic pyranopterin phosphate synthase